MLRDLIPLSLRVGLRNIRRSIKDTLDKRPFSREKAVDFSQYSYLLCERKSRIEKKVAPELEQYQKNKHISLNIAGSKLDGILIPAGEFFSFWRVVGKPSKRNGYPMGFELRKGELSQGRGGGICQITNAMCWLALSAGMDVLERHRHDLDLFPDDRRDVPFGSGATVLYRFKDFVFQNTLPTPVVIRVTTDDEYLIVRLYTTREPDYTVTLEEREHRFYRKDESIHRYNEIWRVTQQNGETREEKLFENDARVLYEVDID